MARIEHLIVNYVSSSTICSLGCAADPTASGRCQKNHWLSCSWTTKISNQVSSSMTWWRQKREKISKFSVESFSSKRKKKPRPCGRCGLCGCRLILFGGGRCIDWRLFLFKFPASCHYFFFFWGGGQWWNGGRCFRLTAVDYFDIFQRKKKNCASSRQLSVGASSCFSRWTAVAFPDSFEWIDYF